MPNAMKTMIQKNITRHLASEETLKSLWCLVYATAIVAAYVFALDHML
jgi:hypothetical protein